jgi:uncharacterized protein (DUF58 family)
VIPREYLKKIRKIEFRTNQLARDLLTGAYHSVFKGRGMDFEEVREYQPGDDVRSIDWNVTAKTGTTHIKKYREERQLTVMILVDVSASGQWGSGEQSKKDLAAEVASVLAFSATRNGDKVGLILHTDQIESFIPPQKGRSHIFRIIREILLYQPESRGTSLKAALDYLNIVQNKPAVVFMISDFLDEGYDRVLKVTARRHDLIAITISDRREQELPDVGRILIEDAETGELVEVNTSDRKVRDRFQKEAGENRAAGKSRLGKAGLDVIQLETGNPYQLELKKFFDNRIRRTGR